MRRIYVIGMCLLVLGLCKTSREIPVKKKSEKENIERIDCNYYWPARRVHVCIKNMPKKECEELFSLGQFVQEKECYCDIHKKKKNEISTGEYIQYDCR